MADEFLELARKGNSRWWRYIIGILIVHVLWLGAAIGFAVAEIIWVSQDGDPNTYLGPRGGIHGVSPIINYMILNLGHVALIAALVLVARALHGRSIVTLITPDPAPSLKRFMRGFTIYFGLVTAATILDWLLYPKSYSVTSQPLMTLGFVPAVLLMGPMQASAEELLYRGYLLQGLGLLTRNKALLVALSGAIFTIPHLQNPEVAAGHKFVVAYYFGFGALMAMVTLRSGSLELAMGAHSAVSVFVGLIVNYKDSAMNTQSLFYCTEMHPESTLVGLVVSGAVFYWALFIMGKKTA